jgi:hypothetical protein
MLISSSSSSSSVAPSPAILYPQQPHATTTTTSSSDSLPAMPLSSITSSSSSSSTTTTTTTTTPTPAPVPTTATTTTTTPGVSNGLKLFYKNPYVAKLSEFKLSTLLKPVISKRIHTYQDQALRFYHLDHMNDIELKHLLDQCRKPSTFAEKKLIELGPKIFECCNASLNTLRPTEASELYSFSGGGDGQIGSVGPSTLERYRQKFYNKFIIGGLRSEDGSFEGLKLILDEMETEYSIEEHEDCDESFVPKIIAELFKIIISATPNSFALTTLFPMCCLNDEIPKRRKSKQANNQNEEEEESSSDEEEEDQDEDEIQAGMSESIYRGSRQVFIDPPETISQVAASGRFFANGLLAAYYYFLLEQEEVSTLSEYLKSFDTLSEFNKAMNKCISYFRNLTIAHHAETTAIVKMFDENHEIVYETRYEKFGLAEFRKGVLNIYAKFEELFQDAEQETKDVVADLLYGHSIREANWKIVESNGKLAYKGEGPHEIAKYFKHLIASKSESELCSFVRESRMLILALTFSLSSGLFRTKSLEGLHLNLLHPNAGNVHLADSMINGYSTLVVNGLSSKQKGHVAIDGHFGVRLSKLFALIAITLVECLAKALVKKWLGGFSFHSLEDHRFYESKLQEQIGWMTSDPICNLNGCIDGAFDGIGKPKLKLPKLLPSSALVNLVKVNPKFENALNQIFVRAFNDNHMTLSLTRKLFSNFNMDCPEFLRQVIKTESDEVKVAIGKRLLENLDVNVSDSTRSALVGDGGAHTSETSDLIYGARAQGSSISGTNFRRGRLLMYLKSFLFEEYFIWENELTMNVEDEPILQGLSVDGPVELGQKMEADIQVETGNESFAFKPQQVTLIEAFYERKSVIVRLGCGHGKTMMHIVMAHQYESGVTVFISPTRALMRSIGEECEKFGVASVEFNANESRFMNGKMWDARNCTRVVLVVVDTAFSTSSRFSLWLHAMDKRKLVNRIVFDEAHFFFDFATFRPIVRSHLN